MFRWVGQLWTHSSTYRKHLIRKLPNQTTWQNKKNKTKQQQNHLAILSTIISRECDLISSMKNKDPQVAWTHLFDAHTEA